MFLSPTCSCRLKPQPPAQTLHRLLLPVAFCIPFLSVLAAPHQATAIDELARSRWQRMCSSYASLTEKSAQRVHALIVADTLDQRIGSSVKHDCDNMAVLFRKGIPQEKLELTILEGENARTDKIKSWIDSLENPEDDTVVFYFAGHGGFAENLGHFLAFRNARLSRRELRKALVKRKPRLLVLLSDCCSNVTPSVGPDYLWVADDGKTAKPSRDIMDALFLRHAGTIDINSSQPGKTAAGRVGGHFTNAFVENCGGRLGDNRRQLKGVNYLIPHWTRIGNKMTVRGRLKVYQSKKGRAPSLISGDINNDGQLSWAEFFFNRVKHDTILNARAERNRQEPFTDWLFDLDTVDGLELHAF